MYRIDNDKIYTGNITKINDLKNIVNICCVENTSIAVNKDGKIYVFGYNDNILKSNNTCIYTPERVKYLPKLLYFME